MKMRKILGKLSRASSKKGKAQSEARPEIGNPPTPPTQETPMADAPKTETQDSAATKTAGEAGKRPQAVGLGIRLIPVENSDQPVVANYTSLNMAPGMVFLDFGFLEPSILAALPRVARSGGKLPERLNGKLAVRVALGYDAVATLHQQLGQVLRGLSQARGTGAKKES